MRKFGGPADGGPAEVQRRGEGWGLVEFRVQSLRFLGQKQKQNKKNMKNKMRKKKKEKKKKKKKKKEREKERGRFWGRAVLVEGGPGGGRANGRVLLSHE